MRRHNQVVHRVDVLKYEELLDQPVQAFSKLISELTGEPADEARVRLVQELFDFSRSGRRSGHEERSSFMRRGVHAVWRHHFTAASAEVFQRYAGQTLLGLGCEADAKWVNDVG